MKRVVIIIGNSPNSYSNIIKSLINSSSFKQLGFNQVKVEIGVVDMARGFLRKHGESIKSVVLRKDGLQVELLNGFASSAVPKINDLKTVDLILLVGLCISFNDEIRIGDLCFPDKFTTFYDENNSFSRPLKIKNELINKLGKGHYFLSVLSNPYDIYHVLPELKGDKLTFFKRLYDRYDVGEMESSLIAKFARDHKKRFGVVLTCSDDRFSSILSFMDGMTGFLQQAINKVLTPVIGTAPIIRGSFNNILSFVNNLFPKYRKLIIAEYERLIDVTTNKKLKSFERVYLNSSINNVVKICKIILEGKLL